MIAPPRPLLLLLTVVVATMGSASCARGPEGLSTTASTGEPIVLHSTGTPPFTRFRYRVEAGHRERTISTAAVNATLDGHEVPTPELRVAMGLEVIEADDHLIDFAITAEHASAGRVVARGLEDERVLATIARDGKLVDVSVDRETSPTLARAMDAMGESLEQAAGSLPPQPIGRGASWTIAGTVELDGFVAERQITYEVVRVDPTAIVLRFEMTGELSAGHSNFGEITGGHVTSSGELHLVSGLVSPAQMDSTVRLSIDLAPKSRPRSRGDDDQPARGQKRTAPGHTVETEVTTRARTTLEN